MRITLQVDDTVGPDDGPAVSMTLPAASLDLAAEPAVDIESAGPAPAGAPDDRGPGHPSSPAVPVDGPTAPRQAGEVEELSAGAAPDRLPMPGATGRPEDGELR